MESGRERIKGPGREEKKRRRVRERESRYEKCATCVIQFRRRTLHAMVTGLLASSQAPEINSTELPEQVKE